MVQASVRSHPQPARRVHEQRVDRVGGEAARVSRTMHEALEAAGARIEEVQALLHRADPEPAIRRLGQARRPVAAQARGVVRVVAELREALGFRIEPVEAAAVRREPETARHSPVLPWPIRRDEDHEPPPLPGGNDAAPDAR